MVFSRPPLGPTAAATATISATISAIVSVATTTPTPAISTSFTAASPSGTTRTGVIAAGFSTSPIITARSRCRPARILRYGRNHRLPMNTVDLSIFGNDDLEIPFVHSKKLSGLGFRIRKTVGNKFVWFLARVVHVVSLFSPLLD